MVTDVAVTRDTNTVTVLGGPTALIHLAGWTLLTDPTFDAAGTEYKDGPVVVRKTADPALKPAQLPALDAVLVSHTGHLDNLDTAGRTVATGASEVFTTVAGAEDLGGAAVGLEPWQTRTLSKPGRTPLNITAVPARHGPVGTEDITGPVTGFLLHTDDGSAPTVYVSGDTVDLDAMSALAQRYRVDVALLHLGATKFAERLQGYIDLSERLRETVPEIDYADLQFDGRIYVKPAGSAAMRSVNSPVRKN